MRIDKGNTRFQTMSNNNDGNYSLTYIKTIKFKLTDKQSIEFEIYDRKSRHIQDEVLSLSLHLIIRLLR